MSEFQAESRAQVPPEARAEGPSAQTTDLSMSTDEALRAKPSEAAGGRGAEAEKPEQQQQPNDPENKPVEEKKSDEEVKEGAPERYDLKLPKGSPLDPAQVERVAALAKERGLSNEQAQALLNEKSQVVSEFVETQKQELKKQSEVWSTQVKTDRELGGDAFNKNVEMAKRVVQRYATDDFKKALNETGLGNHPELVRVFARIGKAMSEDQLVVPGSKPGPVKRSIEDVFYGGTK